MPLPCDCSGIDRSTRPRHEDDEPICPTCRNTGEICCESECYGRAVPAVVRTPGAYVCDACFLSGLVSDLSRGLPLSEMARDCVARISKTEHIVKFSMDGLERVDWATFKAELGAKGLVLEIDAMDAQVSIYDQDAIDRWAAKFIETVKAKAEPVADAEVA